MSKRIAFVFCVCAVTIFPAKHSGAADASSGRLAIVGDKLYVAGIGHGFHIFDISDSRHPKWTGSWQNHTCPVGVQVADGLAYLANRTSGFDVIDVRDSASPARVGHLNTGGDQQTVQVAGRYAYVADARRGLDIIDVSDPRQPKLAGDFDTKGQGWSAVADGDYLYAGYGGGVLRIFHLTHGTSPTLVKEIPTAGSTGLQIADGKLITQHYQWLCLMSLQNPTNPVVTTDSNIGFPVFGSVCVCDSLMFMTSSGLAICSLNKPGKITLLGSVGNVGYQGFGIGVHGNVAYVVDGGSNLHIFDVNDPARPVEVNQVGTANFCSRVLSLVDYVAGKPAEELQVGASEPITNAPPQLADAARTAAGAFTFTLRGVPEGVYFIQASTDMISWTAISTKALPSSNLSRCRTPFSPAIVS